MLLGLVYLHSHSPPILHRDLKSLNILLNGRGADKKRKSKLGETLNLAGEEQGGEKAGSGSDEGSKNNSGTRDTRRSHSVGGRERRDGRRGRAGDQKIMKEDVDLHSVLPV